MRDSNRFRFVSVIFGLLGLLLPFPGCDKGRSEGKTDRTSNRTSVTALGRVTPGRATISIASEPGSRILKLEVKDGQKVHAGDVLAYLDIFPLRTAERDAARVARDEARERLKAETEYAQAQIDQSEE